MKTKTLILGVLLISSISQAAATLADKAQRLEEIEALYRAVPSADIESYRREFSYEQKGLDFDTRVKNESQLLSEKIKTSLTSKYEMALKNTGSAAKAELEIRTALENDLKLVDPQSQENLRKFTEASLKEIQSKLTSQNHVEMLAPMVNRGVRVRMDYFNSVQAEKKSSSAFKPAGPRKVNYESRFAVAKEMVNEENEGLKFDDKAANVSVASSDLISKKASITVQINIEFLGSSINAGPYVNFSRVFATKAVLGAEGPSSFLKNDGTIDFLVRRNGQTLMKAGQPVKRNIFFNCEVTLTFETEYGGQGGFKVAGVGAETEISHRVVQNVSVEGGLIYAPETIGGKMTTMSILREVCNREFLTVKNSNGVSTEGSLDQMMLGFVQSLRLAHPKTQCVVDSHCASWYNGLGMVRVNNIPRCILDPQSGEFATCELRGDRNQNCSLIENGKRVSSGYFEYTCDQGLSCQKVDAGGWFKEGFFGRVWAAPKGGCL